MNKPITVDKTTAKIKPKLFAYLAGPDVFKENPHKIGEEKIEALSKKNVIGLYPIEGSTEQENKIKDPTVIFNENVRLLDKSDIVIANIESLRGPNMDPGTAWEIGYAYAKKLPIILYGATNTYIERCRELNLEGNIKGKDKDGKEIEDMGEAENLMITKSATIIVKTFEEAVQEASKL